MTKMCVSFFCQLKPNTYRWACWNILVSHYTAYNLYFHIALEITPACSDAVKQSREAFQI